MDVRRSIKRERRERRRKDGGIGVKELYMNS
jgi:hypothetical protein